MTTTTDDTVRVAKGFRPMTLSELRAWHMARCEYARSCENVSDATADLWEAKHGQRARHWRNKARDYRNRANFHLGAVQALNDVVRTENN